MSWFAVFTKTIRIESQDYELKLVDTAGHDEYSIFPSQYSINVHGYVLVYSITSMKSFEVVKKIHEKLLDITGKPQWVISGLSRSIINLLRFILLISSSTLRPCVVIWNYYNVQICFIDFSVERFILLLFMKFQSRLLCCLKMFYKTRAYTNLRYWFRWQIFGFVCLPDFTLL